MARQQYSSPEAEAIANIDTAVADLEIVVDELKNTDVANISTEIQNIGVKSIQTGETSVSTSSATEDITISSVDPSKCVVMTSLRTGSSSEVNQAKTTGEILNATTLRLKRVFPNYGSSLYIRWYVIEYK